MKKGAKSVDGSARSTPQSRRPGRPALRRKGASSRRRRNPELLTLTNPARLGDAAARAAFRKFHRVEPSGVRELGGPPGITLVALGDLVELVYRPSKGARRGPAFVHRFKAGATVAATADGRHVLLVANASRPFRVDFERGIVG